MIESDYLEVSDILMKKIHELPVFETINGEDIRGALQLSKIRNYEPGEYIIEEGSFGKSIFFLVSGNVRIVKDGREVSLIRRKGDVFGEMAAIDGSPRSASAYAVSETVCLLADYSHLNRLSGGNRLAFSCILFRVFSEILAERLRSTTDELMQTRNELEKLKKILDQPEQCAAEVK